MDGWIDGWTNEWMNGQTDGQTDRQIDQWMNTCMDTQVDGSSSGNWWPSAEVSWCIPFLRPLIPELLPDLPRWHTILLLGLLLHKGCDYLFLLACTVLVVVNIRVSTTATKQHDQKQVREKKSSFGLH